MRILALLRSVERHSSAYTVHALTDIEFEHHRVAWDEVASGSPDGGPLLSHAWLKTTMRVLAAPGRRFLTYAACRNAGVVAIGAFVWTDGFCRTLRFAGGLPPVDTYGLAHLPGEEDAAMAILSTALRAVQPFDRVLLNGAPQAVAVFARRLPLSGVTVDTNSRILAVVEGSWSDYEADRFSSKLRRELRRQQRRLGELGLVTLRREERDVVGLIRTLGRLHIRRLAERGCRSPFGHDGLRVLRAHIETAVGNRSLGAYVLSVGAQPVSAVLAFELGGRSSVTHLAFDPACSTYGPGILLLSKMMADLALRGVRVLDFGMGDLPYKRRLGNRAEPWYSLSGHAAGSWSGARSTAARAADGVRLAAHGVEIVRFARVQAAGGLAGQLRFLETELGCGGASAERYS